MIGFVIAGLVIGVLARLFSRGRAGIGLGGTLLLGVVASVIGGTVANALGTGDIFELNVLGFVVSVVSAVVLLGIVVGRRAST